MIQIQQFKTIKDKHTKFLYETISNQLNHIESLHSIEQLNNYIKRVLAYLNGFTEKDKLFKNLRIAHNHFPYLYIQWFIEYAKFKIHYMDYPTIKRLDDLLIYTEKQSTFSYLFLITDEHAQKHLHIINDLARIDVLSSVLLNVDFLKKNNQIHFPRQLVEDYHLEETLDGKYLINDRYIALWEMIAHWIKVFKERVRLSFGYFNTTEQAVIDTFIQTQFQALIRHIKKKYQA